MNWILGQRDILQIRSLPSDTLKFVPPADFSMIDDRCPPDSIKRLKPQPPEQSLPAQTPPPDSLQQELIQSNAMCNFPAPSVLRPLPSALRPLPSIFCNDFKHPVKNQQQTAKLSNKTLSNCISLPHGRFRGHQLVCNRSLNHIRFTRFAEPQKSPTYSLT